MLVVWECAYRLGLKRVVNGTRELIQVLYEVDSTSLFQPDPLESNQDEEEGDESQSQSQAPPRREPIPYLSLLSHSDYTTKKKQ